ncbi:MAG: sugar transferase [Kiritimatiellae bacterium]|nr:sugar transferase [Kiritimatiellia bacterium]
MKRLCDICLVLLSAPFWLPVMGIVALMVWMKLGKPVFFTQERAGLGGRAFRILKFRTMRTGEGTDAERLTPFGRFLRASSLDELPELLLVLKGTMSLVGPRPLPTVYLPRYSPEQMRRHEVRPGITGWAQVNGRNLLSWEEKFAHDVWYVDHRSLALDFKILFLTVATVFRSTGISAKGEATMGEFKGAKS